MGLFRKKEKRDELKYVLFKVKHDLVSSLSIIDNDVSCMGKYWPLFVDVYQKAKAAGVDVSSIEPGMEDEVNKLIKSTREEVDYCRWYLSAMIMKIQKIDKKNYSLSQLSVLKCVHEALSGFRPRYDLENKQRIHVEGEDFKILGNEGLFLQVLYNLFTNADYFIFGAQGGDLYLTTVQTAHSNELHVRDTGCGIPKNILQRKPAKQGLDCIFAKVP